MLARILERDALATWMDMVDALRLRALRLRGARSRRVETALGDVHLLEWSGTGTLPPVVLFHGLASCGVDYAPLMAWLRRRHTRIIAPDLPGHGWSSTPAEPLTADRVTTAMIAAMDQVIDEPVLAIGNSLGGIAAIRYAQIRPARVNGLILISPGGAPMDAAALNDLRGVFDFEDLDVALAFMHRVFARPQPGMRWFARGVRQRMARPGPRSLLDNITPDVLLRPADMAGLRVPTVVMWGDEDGVLPPDSRQFFRDHLPPRGTFEPLPGFGHTPYVDDLRGFCARLDALVDQCVSAMESTA